MTYVKEFGVPKYHSLGHRIRKAQIKQRVLRREARAKYHSEARKGLRSQKEITT